MKGTLLRDTGIVVNGAVQMLFIEQFHSSPFKERREIEPFVYNQFI